MNIKKIVRTTLIILTILYALAGIIGIVVITKQLKENEFIDWVSAIIIFLSIPCGLWLAYFVAPWATNGFRRKKIKHILAISLGFALLGVCLQLGASFIMARVGFGFGPDSDCCRCNAKAHYVDGRYLPGHYFYIKMHYIYNKGNPDCWHKWIESNTYGHADGCYPIIYGPMLDWSHYLFWSAGGLVVIFCLYLVFINYSIKSQNTTQLL